MHRRHIRVAALLLALLMTGCGGGAEPTTPTGKAAAEPPSGHGCARTFGLALGHPSDSGIPRPSRPLRCLQLEAEPGASGRLAPGPRGQSPLPAEPPEAAVPEAVRAIRVRGAGQPREALRHALALALDWVQANPKDDPNSVERVDGQGDRRPRSLPGLPGLGGPLRGHVGRGRRARRLARRARRGAREPRHLRARQPRALRRHRPLSRHPLRAGARAGPGLGELAKTRFLQTLRGRVAEGVWLEHSSFYEFLVLRAVERFLDDVGSISVAVRHGPPDARGGRMDGRAGSPDLAVRRLQQDAPAGMGAARGGGRNRPQGVPGRRVRGGSRA